MLRTILKVLAAVLAIFLVVVALQSPQFHVERSIAIAAPPERVFSEINELARWQAWSPWAKRDPAATTRYEGPASGVGAVFHWSGNDEVGEGLMKITESRAPERIALRLTFLRPFAGSSDVSFALKPEGSGTAVTWAIDGEQGFIERALCTLLRLDMDEMIGKDYEAGLAALKSVVESSQPS